jgi:predicted Zn-dependent protease
MKRPFFFFALALVAAIAGFSVTQRLQRDRLPDEMAWLRTEFSLTDNQAREIARLHDAYRPVCAEHCRRIMEARERLDQLEHNGKSDTTDYASARANWDALCSECMRATQQHLEAVAAKMPPESAQRYLALVGSKLTRQEPGHPFGLR